MVDRCHSRRRQVSQSHHPFAAICHIPILHMHDQIHDFSTCRCRQSRFARGARRLSDRWARSGCPNSQRSRPTACSGSCLLPSRGFSQSGRRRRSGRRRCSGRPRPPRALGSASSSGACCSPARGGGGATRRHASPSESRRSLRPPNAHKVRAKLPRVQSTVVA